MKLLSKLTTGAGGPTALVIWTILGMGGLVVFYSVISFVFAAALSIFVDAPIVDQVLESSSGPVKQMLVTALLCAVIGYTTHYASTRIKTRIRMQQSGRDKNIWRR